MVENVLALLRRLCIRNLHITMQMNICSHFQFHSFHSQHSLYLMNKNLKISKLIKSFSNLKNLVMIKDLYKLYN